MQTAGWQLCYLALASIGPPGSRFKRKEFISEFVSTDMSVQCSVVIVYKHSFIFDQRVQLSYHNMTPSRIVSVSHCHVILPAGGKVSQREI